MIKWSEIKFFKPEEFLQFNSLRDPIPYILDDIRESLGKPIIITSSFRTKEQNIAAGGVENSSHCIAPDGLYSGIDFAPIDGMTDKNKYIILDELFVKQSIARIGIYKRHFHIDCETHLPSPVLWISDSN